MPRRSLHNPLADHLPAFGLKDDVRDEQLRASTADPADRERLGQSRKRPRQLKESDDVDDIDDVEDSDDTEDDVDVKVRAAEDYIGRALRKEYYAALKRLTYHDWRSSNHITSSEVACMLGAELLDWPEITSNVKAFLFAHELTREKKRFDVEGFLTEKLGFLPKTRRKWEWEGNYSLPDIRHKLVLDHDTRGTRVVVNVRGRRRLTVYFAGGRVKSDGKSEAGIVRELTARALKSRQRSGPSTVWDNYAVCVPRTEHFRKAIRVEEKNAHDTDAARPMYFMVERGSATVIGLREAYTFDD